MRLQSTSAGFRGEVHHGLSLNNQLIAIIMGLTAVSALGGPEEYLPRNDEWYASGEADSIARNILSHQSRHGGWPKNSDTTATLFIGNPTDLHPTFDNGATTGELRFLARIFRTTARQEYETSFLKGLKYILDAQYANGGWPQYSPPGDGYHRHITFNDNSMTRLMWLLRDVAHSHEYNLI